MNYYEGEEFERFGMIVTATYNDGSTTVVADYTYSPTGPLSSSDTEITITYSQYGDTRTVVLPIRVAIITPASSMWSLMSLVLLALAVAGFVAARRKVEM